MNDPILVREAASFWDRRRFQNLPWAIYRPAGAKPDPNWVPPILSQERLLLGWGHHPFYDNAGIATFLALRGGKTVGRLGVLVNRIHNQKYNEKTGFFGFFESIDDPAVARTLFDAGEAWLRGQGMTTVRGPANPTLNYTCGLLVDGFDRPPCFLMTYNPPYYGPLIEGLGFAKSQDMYSYEMDSTKLAAITERYKPAVMSRLDRPDLSIRPLAPAKFDQELRTYLDIYNRSLDGTWGFTPLQPREVEHIAAELRHLIIPEFTAFAVIDGVPVGALLALIDYNQIIAKINGRLLPFGLIKLVTGRRKINSARALGMTMVPGYQLAGLGIVLLDAIMDPARKWGINHWEFSWVLESNTRSRGSLERTGLKIAKTYRMYDKAL